MNDFGIHRLFAGLLGRKRQCARHVRVVLPTVAGFVPTRSNAQSTGIVLPLNSTCRHPEKPISVDFGHRSGQLGARNDRLVVGDGALGRAGCSGDGRARTPNSVSPRGSRPPRPLSRWLLRWKGSPPCCCRYRQRGGACLGEVGPAWRRFTEGGHVVRRSGGGLVHSHVAVRNLAQGHCERGRRAPGRLCGGDDGPRRRIRAAGEQILAIVPVVGETHLHSFDHVARHRRVLHARSICVVGPGAAVRENPAGGCRASPRRCCQRCPCRRRRRWCPLSNHPPAHLRRAGYRGRSDSTSTRFVQDGTGIQFYCRSFIDVARVLGRSWAGLR